MIVILSIISFIITCIEFVLNWFKRGNVPSDAVKAKLAIALNRAGRLKAACATFGVVAAPDDPNDDNEIADTTIKTVHANYANICNVGGD